MSEISPVRYDLTIQRHAPWAPETPFWLADQATGAPPFDLTGATIEIMVRLYDEASGDPLLTASTAGSSPNSRVEITDGPGCAFIPFFKQSDVEALPGFGASALRHADLTMRVKYRWDCRITLAGGARFYAWEGILTVDGTVVR